MSLASCGAEAASEFLMAEKYELCLGIRGLLGDWDNKEGTKGTTG